MGASYQFDFPRLTPVVRTLLIAIGVVFVGQLIAAMALGYDVEAVRENVTMVFGLYSPNLLRGFVWQPLTYAFLHSMDGFAHVLVNGLMLYLFGCRVEAALSRKRFLTLYFGAALSGAVFVLVGDLVSVGLLDGRATLVTGASGAIAGVVAAYCWMHWNQWMLLFFLRVQGKHLLALIVFLDVLRSLMSNISLAAHLGGIAFGLLWISGRANPRLLYLRWQHRQARRKLAVVQGGRSGKDDWVN